MSQDANGPAGIRTRTALAGQRILSPLRPYESIANSETCSSDPATATNSATNAAQNIADLTALTDALAALPEADRPVVVAHVAS